MYNSQYLDEVFIDIQDAKEWYKYQKEGLEIDFANAIETAIKKVLLMPTAYSVRYKNVRFAHPETFPYNIHFYIDQSTQTVVFTAVVHNKRDPKFAINR